LSVTLSGIICVLRLTQCDACLVGILDHSITVSLGIILRLSRFLCA